MRNFGTIPDDRMARLPHRRRRELGFLLSAAAVVLFFGVMLGAASATWLHSKAEVVDNVR